MRLFKRKYIKVKREAWEVIRQGVKAALNNNAELNEYRKTGLSSVEIHMVSERLGEFELAGLEPQDVRELADRDKAIKGERKYNLICCPICGNILCTPKYAEKIKFCSGCGKRVDTDVEKAPPHPSPTVTPSPRGGFPR